MNKLFFCVVLFVCGISQAQSVYKLVTVLDSIPDKYSGLNRSFNLSISVEAVLEILEKTNQITLPNKSGKPELFTLVTSHTLSPELQNQFPSILSFCGQSTSNPSKKIRLDFNEKGLFAWVKSPIESYFVHSLETDKNQLILFDEADYKANKSKEYLELEPRRAKETEVITSKSKARTAQKTNGGTLRTYRMAVSCTGEYTQYQGGTKALALAAIVVSINRINEVFENELSVRLELISGMEAILFTNAFTDPYNNESASQLIDQVQTEIDNRIGKNNYDIGHVFSTGGGGIAQLGSVCGDYKAMGVTGSETPIGDPFDIDYVAHELGHQFGAEHTFNSEEKTCEGDVWEFSAYEPGSGSTIMGYAGLCEPHNIQQNSDAYFHVRSLDEIVSFLNSKGSTCGTPVNVNNTPPKVSVDESGFVIPISTPFKLQGSANDTEDTELTYCWEEFDLGPSGSPLEPLDNAPIFRSFPPTDNPVRYFPNMDDIRTGQSSFGELLPNYSRDLTFRLTVRDNHVGGGAINDAKIAFKSASSVGPFIVTSQSTPVTYFVNEEVEITWNVANTNVAPVNASFVNILLSTDGGYTYPIVLKTHVPNDGSESVIIPNQLTNVARIMVESANNIFFNINKTDFVIAESSTPDFALNSSTNYQDICPPDSFVFDVSISRFADFDEAINLTLENVPDGVTYYFTEVELTADMTSQLVLKPLENHQPGNYEVTIKASSTSVIRIQLVNLRTHTQTTPTVGELVSPPDGAINVGVRPQFEWESFVDADSYVLELSTEPSFVSAEVFNVDSTQWTFKATLLADENYFWRVKGINSCGQSAYSSIYEFTTVHQECAIYSNNTPVPMPNQESYFYSSVSATLSGLVTDINILSITGEHEWTSDLTFYLKSPLGSSVKLLSDVCNNAFGEDFNMGFDDESLFGYPLCPPTDGVSRLPAESLASFNGEAAEGEWTLVVFDAYDFVDEGRLLSWQLEVCTGSELVAVDEEVKSTVRVFPNPANNYIEFKGLLSINKITVYNSFGQLVLESNQTALDIRILQSGVYFYLIEGGKEEYRGKFVKL